LVSGAVSFSSATNIATFVPSVALAAYSTYNVAVSNVISSAGLALQSQVVSSFTTGPAVVAIAPSIVAITPAAFTSSVAINSQVAVQFGTAMMASTITTSNIVVTNAFGQAVAGSLSFNEVTNIATFAPVGGFSAFSSYNVQVSNVLSSAGVALSTAYTSSFTTAGVAIVAPAIVAITPAQFTSSVSVTSQIAVQFNTAIMASSLTASNFVVTNAFGQLVAGSISFNSMTNIATFVPGAALAAYSTYNVQIANVVSTAGVALSSSVVSSFTTGAALIAPTIVAITPCQSSMGVSLVSPISVAFGTAMLASSISAQSLLVVNAFGQVIPGTVSFNAFTNVATFVPYYALSPVAQYTVIVQPSVMSVAGIGLGSQFTSSFITGVY